MSCSRFLASAGFVLLVGGLWSTGVLAQDAAPDPLVEAATQTDLTPEQLKFRVDPLDATQLEAVAKHWKGVFQAKAAEISTNGEAILGAEGEEKTSLQKKSVALKTERVILADKVRVVLAEWVSKGGDVAAYETYIAKTGSVATADPTDVNAIWVSVQGWVLSPEGGMRWGFNILQFIIVLLIAKFVAGIVASVARKGLAKVENISDLLREFIVNSSRRVIFLLGLVVALSMLEVNIGPLLAGIGVVGFVIGFALQDTLSNFAAGFMILLYRPYDVGDFVTAGGVTGVVQSMSLVSTTFKTGDNQRITVPNGTIWGGMIQNVTANPTRRVDMVFGIGYGDDIDKARRAIEEIVAGHELILKDPEPVIKVAELADSSVNFIVRPWTKTADYWAVYWDLTEQVKKRFDADGISIPFPQQDVHMHQAS